MKKSKKIFGATISALAVCSAVSLSAFAYSTDKPSSSTMFGAEENKESIVKVDEKTGQIKMSSDGGKTWDDVVLSFETGNIDLDENTEIAITTFDGENENSVVGLNFGKTTIVKKDEESGIMKISKDGGKIWKDIDFELEDGEFSVFSAEFEE